MKVLWNLRIDWLRGESMNFEKFKQYPYGWRTMFRKLKDESFQVESAVTGRAPIVLDSPEQIKMQAELLHSAYCKNKDCGFENENKTDNPWLCQEHLKWVGLLESLHQRGISTIEAHALAKTVQTKFE